MSVVGVMRWGIALIIMMALTACDDRVESHFPDYAAIPAESGVWTWLPSFFPPSASEIVITTNLDLTLFYADFNVAGDDERTRFEATLSEESGVRFIDASHQRWCKAGKTIWNHEAQEKPLFINKLGEDRYRITNDEPACSGFLSK